MCRESGTLPLVRHLGERPRRSEVVISIAVLGTYEAIPFWYAKCLKPKHVRVVLGVPDATSGGVRAFRRYSSPGSSTFTERIPCQEAVSISSKGGHPSGQTSSSSPAASAFTACKGRSSLPFLLWPSVAQARRAGSGLGTGAGPALEKSGSESPGGGIVFRY